MIVKLAEFLSQCPAIEGVGVKVNYLAGKSAAYSLMKTGERIEKKKYADGGTVYGQRFVLAMRGEYAAASTVNVATADKCSAIEHWIAEQAVIESIADLKTDAQVLELELVKGFVPVAMGSVDARFEAVLEISYYAV